MIDGDSDDDDCHSDSDDDDAWWDSDEDNNKTNKIRFIVIFYKSVPVKIQF